jgi:hypothetical protein
VRSASLPAPAVPAATPAVPPRLQSCSPHRRAQPPQSCCARSATAAPVPVRGGRGSTSARGRSGRRGAGGPAGRRRRGTGRPRARPGPSTPPTAAPSGEEDHGVLLWPRAIGDQDQVEDERVHGVPVRNPRPWPRPRRRWSRS